MKSCILMAIALCLFSCGDEQVSPPPTSTTVHLAGFLAKSNMDGDNVASYWRDNVYAQLTDDDIDSRTSSLYVDGSSAIMGGWKHDGTGGTTVIWKDGEETVVDDAIGGALVASRNNNLFGAWLGATTWEYYKNGTSQLLTDTAYAFALTAMTLQGDDIYMSGYSSGPSLPPNYSPPQHAQYWKNSQLIFRESGVSNAFAIFTHQNDVYMAGQFFPTTGDNSVACYWKNGQRVDLTDGSVSAVAKSVFATDEHVYVAGMIDNEAVYWKDGEAITLTTETTYSMCNSIFVQGTDVHVGGYQSWHPAYWKNDVRQDITNQDELGQILFVVVGSN